jgi:hypothetical protein
MKKFSKMKDIDFKSLVEGKLDALNLLGVVELNDETINNLKKTREKVVDGGEFSVWFDGVVNSLEVTNGKINIDKMLVKMRTFYNKPVFPPENQNGNRLVPMC